MEWVKTEDNGRTADGSWPQKHITYRGTLLKTNFFNRTSLLKTDFVQWVEQDRKLKTEEFALKLPVNFQTEIYEFYSDCLK